MTNETRKPSHHAYIVPPTKEGSEKKAKWIEVGAVWPHKNGEGFDLVIPQGLSLSGRIVCMPAKADE
jgi:hypothetical protein